MKITAGRLALLNKESEQTIFDIEDLMDNEGRAAGAPGHIKNKIQGKRRRIFMSPPFKWQCTQFGSKIQFPKGGFEKGLLLANRLL